MDLSREVRKEVELINQNLPGGMRLNLSYDSSVFIQESIDSVYKTVAGRRCWWCWLSFFFLRSVRASVIPIVTIPVSLVGAFGFMYLFGFSTTP